MPSSRLLSAPLPQHTRCCSTAGRVPTHAPTCSCVMCTVLQLYFRPTTTKMLGNLKIFTIAILMRTVMHRHFNILQYEALFLLVAGAGQADAPAGKAA